MTSIKRRVTVLNPLQGEGDRKFPARGTVGPNTSNVIPDNRGYLKGYTGNVRMLPADLAPPGLNGPVEWASLNIVQAMKFENRNGVVKRVFITSDWQAWTLRGNRPILIHTFLGRVKLLQFQDIVIFMSKTEPPRKWDGVEAVTYLGVREVPRAPEIRLATANFLSWGRYFRRRSTWGMDNTDVEGTGLDVYTAPCPLQDRNRDPDAQHDNSFEWRVAYYNTRGQIGRASSPTTMVIPAMGDPNDYEAVEFPTSDVTELRADGNYLVWPIVEWLPPSEQEDIAGAVLYRTINQLNVEEAGLFQIHSILPLPCSHVTDTRADGSLLTVHLESDGYPGPQGAIGATYKDVVLIAGDSETPRTVRYCVAGTPENWPQLNAYNARDVITAILPLSKSVVIVTKSSIETLVQIETGAFVLARVEETKGSIFGNTMSVYKDNVIGFFNSGFGIFDGFTHKQLNNTLGYLSDEIDVDDDAFSWVSPDGLFFVATQTRGRGQQILVYHFAFNAWFRLDATPVYSVWIENDQVLFGGSENITAFNKAAAGSGSIELILGGLEEDALALSWFRKSIGRIFMHFQSMGDFTYQIKAYKDEDLAGDPYMTGSISAMNASDTIIEDDLWDEDCAEWNGPRFNWHTLETACGNAQFNSLRFVIDWTGDISLSGFAFEVMVSDEG